MIKPLFALLALSLALPALAGNPADDAFNAAVTDINDAVAKIVAGQVRRSQAAKAEATPAPKPLQCTPAEADKAYTDLKRCDDSIKKAFGSGVLDASGAVASKGFSYGGGMSLVLLTTTDAFFYHEDCDICAAVERCSLKDGKVTTFKAAHSVDCGDLAAFLKKGVVYSACK
jgi:hypothetical protein